MRLLLLGVLMLLGCTPSISRPLVEDMGASAPAGARLLVRGEAEADTLDEWAVFLPVDLDEASLGGWSAEALRSAGYHISVVELEDTVESAPAQVSGGGASRARALLPAVGGGTDALPQRPGLPGPPPHSRVPRWIEERHDVPDSHRLPQAAHPGVPEEMGLRQR